MLTQVSKSHKQVTDIRLVRLGRDYILRMCYIKGRKENDLTAVYHISRKLKKNLDDAFFGIPPTLVF